MPPTPINFADSPALLTDLYQLTMAQGYWKSGKHTSESVFHLFFRRAPFGSGFTVACGLPSLVELLSEFRFRDDDIAYLETLKGNNGDFLFHSEFLDLLRGLRLTCRLDAVPEGTVVFPHEPLLRMTGPIIECQILETLLLNVINFQTLIATKAARICAAAASDPVLEFGLRRAQGTDGGLAASRAAYVGGCTATSNVLAGKKYDIPVRGTHAHSWVMSFDSEIEAFEAYAEAMPNNCVFLVDTYDTVEGVRKAINTGQKLRSRGHELIGIRLDSGDLTELSITARTLLDEAGFPGASVVASNDLDEFQIRKLKAEGARIDIWGVGTRLVTAFDQPALGGVYKLAAIRDKNDMPWTPRIKLSEESIKTSNPGILQVRRFYSDGKFKADCIFDERHDFSDDMMVPVDETDVTFPISGTDDYEDLLQPVLIGGELVAELPSIHESRQRAQSQIDRLPESYRCLDAPEKYKVGLSPKVAAEKQQLINEATNRKHES